MSVTTEGMGGGGDDPNDGRDDTMRKVVEHATATAIKKRKRLKGDVANQPPVKKQARITNYFPPRGQQQPPPATFVSDEELAASMPVTVSDNIEITGEEGEFGAKDTETNQDVASLTLYWDDPDEIYWVNNIEVNEDYRRRGIASAMLKRACNEHGTVYFSTQTAEDDDAADTRHLTSDGYALARAACNDARLNCEMAQPGNVFVRDDADEPENADAHETEHVEEDPPGDGNSTDDDKTD